MPHPPSYECGTKNHWVTQQHVGVYLITSLKLQENKINASCFYKNILVSETLIKYMYMNYPFLDRIQLNWWLIKVLPRML